MKNRSLAHCGVIVALMLVMKPAVSRSEEVTALNMLDYCQMRERTEVGYGFCAGAFITINKLLHSANHKNNTSVIFGICPTFQTSAQQVQNIFVKYTVDHPQYQSLDYVQVTLLALSENFVCRPTD